MIRTLVKWATLTAICTLLVACASRTNIATNKASDYTREPKRIFVIANIGDELGIGYRNGFEKKTIELFQRCGAEMQFAYLSPLELDESIYEKKRIAYQPDAVLSIRRNGGTTDAYGAVLLMGIYDIKLFDVQTNKVVWRGATKTSRGGSMSNQPVGEGLAVALRDKLKEDQILRSCPNDGAPGGKSVAVAPELKSPIPPIAQPNAKTPTTPTAAPIHVAKAAVLGPFKPGKPLPLTLDMVRNRTWTYPHPVDFEKNGNVELLFSDTGVQVTSKTGGAMGSFELRDGALCLSLVSSTSFCVYVVEESGQKMVFFTNKGSKAKLTIE